jgi:hypothetical protein
MLEQPMIYLYLITNQLFINLNNLLNLPKNENFIH